MAIIKVPVDPYWINAVHWYSKNIMYDNIYNSLERQAELERYDAWMESQGATVVRNGDYYPWLHFTDPSAATMFILRWA